MRVEKPEVPKGLSRFEIEFCATRGKVVGKGFGRGFTGKGKGNLLSIGKSVYGGAGHTSLR